MPVLRPSVEGVVAICFGGLAVLADDVTTTAGRCVDQPWPACARARVEARLCMVERHMDLLEECQSVGRAGDGVALAEAQSSCASPAAAAMPRGVSPLRPPHGGSCRPEHPQADRPPSRPASSYWQAVLAMVRLALEPVVEAMVRLRGRLGRRVHAPPRAAGGPPREEDRGIRRTSPAWWRAQEFQLRLSGTSSRERFLTRAPLRRCAHEKAKTPWGPEPQQHSSFIDLLPGGIGHVVQYRIRR